MLDLFHAPGSCSLGIRVILEEIGAPYALHQIDLAKGEQRGEAYRRLNPKGKVPALRLPDGTVLTEFQAIAFWLAQSHPWAALLPAGIEAQARACEALDFMVGSLHMRGFTLALVPGKFVTDPQAQAELRAHGLTVAAEGLAHLAQVMGDADWLLGDYGIADAALFYLISWAERAGMALPENLAGFHRRMLARPAVQRALEPASAG
ncbi:MAG: glutathione S-transferase family protein [Pseudodonghicola sp.]